jgi:hypothetical protein
MNILRRNKTAMDEQEDWSEEELPAPPAFCARITPEQMLEQSRKLTEDRLRELDMYLREHPEGMSPFLKPAFRLALTQICIISSKMQLPTPSATRRR